MCLSSVPYTMNSTKALGFFVFYSLRDFAHNGSLCNSGKASNNLMAQNQWLDEGASDSWIANPKQRCQNKLLQ